VYPKERKIENHFVYIRIDSRAIMSQKNNTLFCTHQQVINSMTDDCNNPMLFGKHKNKYTWINIYQNDKKYCDWILKQTPTYLQFLLFKQFVERMRFMR